MAPLSATVMSAVPAERSGLASGMNSAVSRLSGVLAVAALGAVALASFSQALDIRAASLALPAPARAELLAQSSRFGAAQPPADLAGAQRTGAGEAIRNALVDAFRRVCAVSASLCFAGALVALVTLPARRIDSGRP